MFGDNVNSCLRLFTNKKKTTTVTDEKEDKTTERMVEPRTENEVMAI